MKNLDIVRQKQVSNQYYSNNILNRLQNLSLS